MVSSKFGVAICTLNQLALDFSGNLSRILASINRAIELGATVRIGPELEVTGYGCEDAFYELDTVYHCWQMVGEVIKQQYTNILINIGMPVVKDGSLYNCVVAILNSKIVLIRPKNRLAINGNYRENRWFTPWGDGTGNGSLTWFQLPSLIRSLTGQQRVPFGDGAILEIGIQSSLLSSFDLVSSHSSIRLGYEICEELWQPDTQCGRLYGLRGCHLIMNISGSYWELRKLDSAISHARSATAKSGGAYAYVNNIGCDGGGRLCYYGRSFVIQNGDILAMTSHTRETIFDECEVAIAWIDPNTIQQYRSQKNISTQSVQVNGDSLSFVASTEQNSSPPYSGLQADATISAVKVIHIEQFPILSSHQSAASQPIEVQLKLTPEEEILRYCSLWLWDYLRRCVPGGIKGFIVPLSGGLDSCSVACIVYCLSHLLHHQIFVRKNRSIEQQLKPIFDGESDVKSPFDICRQLLRCCYLQTQFSGADSHDRAQELATVIGAQFVSYNFNHLYQSIVDTVPMKVVGGGGKPNEVTLQQQNVQARLRMVLTYYMSECNRLVLATGNVDEALVGYLTKYDCSSADINPIGSISKNDLRRFIHFCKGIIPNSESILEKMLTAIPSAELTGEQQKDEDDLGLTYDELSLFGRVRRGEFGTYGPYGMFTKIWDDRDTAYVQAVFSRYRTTNSDNNNDQFSIDPTLLATKVKRFFTLYSRNRHKQTILTPALHTETYSPDDNRFDHRQFLFNTKWPWQFDQIDQLVAKIVAKEIV